MQTILTTIKPIAIATAYAVVARFIFGVVTLNDLFSVMSITFLFLSPCIAGALTVYFSPSHKAKSFVYRIFAPWIPIVIFLGLTLLFAWEGWACWVMALPLFLFAASIGGIVGGMIKSDKEDKKIHISILTLLPFLCSPLESWIGSLPGTYTAYTYIDIHAPADKIWKNVTRVNQIPQEQDKGWLTKTLGFPRPVKAELNYEGVGAYREAIFTNGLVFHETVLEYSDKRKMVFAIKAYPHEIPSTTMDEHVVIGGNYFDVLNGTYELESLNKNTYRLHLYSHFKLNTTFNFYASWWAR